MARARREAGLTLAQVAGSEVSRVAIHKIEHGLTRPTPSTLRLIADRLGRPAASLLAQPEAAVDEQDRDLELLERLAAEERFSELEQPARRLLVRLPAAAARARVDLLLGMGLVRLHQADEAGPFLARARAHYEEAGNEWQVVECLDWEAAALFLLENGQALAVAREALRRCRTLDPMPLPTLVRVLGRVAMVHMDLRDWDEAIAYYEEAVESAGPLKDLRRTALMYLNLGLAYGELGQLNRAAALGQKATGIFQMLRDRLNLARVIANLAMVYLRQGRGAEAEASVLQAISEYEAVGNRRGLAVFHVDLAEVHLQQGQLDGCARALEQAEELAVEMAERLTLATVHQSRGRLAAARQDHLGCDIEFSTALSILRAEGAGERLAECTVVYARLLRDRGELDAAFERMEEAATLPRPHLARQQALAAFMTG